jgi:CO dehydrogenase maturation factor
MAFVIALAGKGGTGKTSFSALAIRYLVQTGRVPVLGVDADANSSLNEVLGVNVHTTVGRLREESLAAVKSGVVRPGGMSMEELFDYQIQQSIIEARGFDLIVMGRPEGAGCYCAANNIIRKYLDKLTDSYPYMVIDNEAGLEHLSRKTTNSVDVLIIMSDASVRGIRTAKRIHDLIGELGLEIRKNILVINRAKDNEHEELRLAAEGFGLPVAGFIPHDESISIFDLHGTPVFALPEDSDSVRAVSDIMASLFR